VQDAGYQAGAVYALAVWAVLPSTGGREIDECLRISAVCRRELLGRESGALIAARSKSRRDQITSAEGRRGETTFCRRMFHGRLRDSVMPLCGNALSRFEGTCSTGGEGLMAGPHLSPDIIALMSDLAG
jgi:hypothetical protein